MARRTCIASSAFCLFLSVSSATVLSGLGGKVTTDEMMGDELDDEDDVVVMLSQPSELMTSISCMGSTASK